MDTRGAMLLDGDGSIHVSSSDQPINENHRRIAEIISDFDPYLSLHFIPPGSRGPLDRKPWAVVHSPPGKKPYYVLYAEDADERLLARLWSIDNANKDVLGEMEAMNAAREALKMKQQMDAIGEQHAMAASVLRSRKYHYKHDGVDYGELR